MRDPDRLKKIPFSGTLRPNQQRAAKAIRTQLKQGATRLHIVAPPGSGKTVLGLYVWAQLVRRPALVLSPTSAIQMQWLARTDLFKLGKEATLSSDAGEPGAFTSLTYQALTLPRRADESLDEAARRAWVDRLLAEREAESEEAAEAWLTGLSERNPAYFAERLSIYRRGVTEELTRTGNATEALHASSRGAIERLRAAKVGLIILDECHHLLGHWGRVLSDAHELFEDPVILGLTATPPETDGKDERDVERYRSMLGPVDFEVPVPAVVKEGRLAPYQDLVHLVRPLGEELAYVEHADRSLHEIVGELETERAGGGSGERTPALSAWVADALENRRVALSTRKDWATFVRADETLANDGRLYLRSRGMEMPEGVPSVEARVLVEAEREEPILLSVIDRYVRHGLRVSRSSEDHALAERTVERLRLLGAQITERGLRACASPVGRVLAHSGAKARALVTILARELEVLGDKARCVVVTDFERQSAHAGAPTDVLSPDSGGAVAAFSAIVADEATDPLDPVLVTGTTLLVDDDLSERFLGEARAWLGERGLEVELAAQHPEPGEDGAARGFVRITGRGGAWSPRVYVELVTSLFQRGVTKCLVGTRGLLGEGWDASRTNVLVDLTSVTSPMSVNQLRGRSIRIDSEDPKKVADNWDVVCVADEFARGLDDYARFVERHSTLYGVTDDEAIEKGVGHVHAAFTEVGPEDVASLREPINAEMLGRVAKRTEARKRWKIGSPFEGVAEPTLEVRPRMGSGGFPAFRGSRMPWSDASLTQAIARAVGESLRNAGLIEMAAGKGAPGVSARERAGGYLRVSLRTERPQDAALFAEAFGEVMGPLEKPRYVVERVVDIERETWLSRLLPGIVGRYFRGRRRSLAMVHAVPRVLAKNRELADIFAERWSRHVSPSEALYAHRGPGEALLTRARAEGLAPRALMHRAEVFR